MTEQNKKPDSKFKPTGVTWEEAGQNFQLKEGEDTYNVGLGVEYRQTELIEDQKAGDVIFTLRMYGKKLQFGPHANPESVELAQFPEDQRPDVKLVKDMIEEAVAQAGGYEKLIHPDLEATLQALLKII